MKGSSLAGYSLKRDRVKNDFYATPYESTELLLDNVIFNGNFLEPCCGEGHISEVVKEYYPHEPIYNMDIVDRGYDNTLEADFLNYDFLGQTFDNIITNPPYSLAEEFLRKGMEVVNIDGKIAMFLKIQFLEGQKRRELFKQYPPKYIYVFSKRQNPWRNGSPTDEKGKPWSSTMCFAWFIWEKGFTGEPVIRWL